MNNLLGRNDIKDAMKSLFEWQMMADMKASGEFDNAEGEAPGPEFVRSGKLHT